MFNPGSIQGFFAYQYHLNWTYYLKTYECCQHHWLFQFVVLYNVMHKLSLEGHILSFVVCDDFMFQLPVQSVVFVRQHCLKAVEWHNFVIAIQSIYSILIWLLHHALTVKIVLTQSVFYLRIWEKKLYFYKNSYIFPKKWLVTMTGQAAVLSKHCPMTGHYF